MHTNITPRYVQKTLNCILVDRPGLFMQYSAVSLGPPKCLGFDPIQGVLQSVQAKCFLYLVDDNEVLKQFHPPNLVKSELTVPASMLVSPEISLACPYWDSGQAPKLTGLLARCTGDRDNFNDFLPCTC